MMRLAIIDYLNFYKFPAGRLLTALRAMLRLVEGIEDSGALRRTLRESVEEQEALFQLELRWRYRKQHRVEHGERAAELDQQLDRYLKGVAEVLESQRRFADITPGRAQAAEDMSQALFPHGIGRLTQMSYSDQCNAVFHLLEVYDQTPAYRNLAEQLGFVESMDAIRELNAAYSREVSAARPPKREDLLAARRQAELRLGEILARIFGRFPTESEEDQQARARLLAPIEHQNEALRVLNRRHVNRKLLADDEGEDIDADDGALDIDPQASEFDEDPQAEAA